MDSGIGRIGSRISQVIFLPRAIRDIPRFERTSLPTAPTGASMKVTPSYDVDFMIDPHDVILAPRASG